MCLVAIALGAHPFYPLIIAANRDEFHARPSRVAQEWQDLLGVYGGRDLARGGSWFAATRAGRFALVTNIRRVPVSAGRSRGTLIQQFMPDPIDARACAEELARKALDYRPFNLLVGTRAEAYFIHSDRGKVHGLKRGVHGLSNADLNTPWPKTERLSEVLRGVCARAEDPHDALWDALADTGVAPDADLPDTGIGLDRERVLSAAFIVGENYGTRASTLLSFASDGRARLVERSFGPSGVPLGETVLEWEVKDSK